MFTQVKYDIKRPFAKTEHTDDGHFYRTENGDLYPSITTIFKLVQPGEDQDWYGHWIQSVMRKEGISKIEAIEWCKVYSESSMTVGTEMHRLAEAYVGNNCVSMFDKTRFEKNPMELFEVLKTWLDENIEEVHGIEAKLYSDELGIAGTVDLVAVLKTGEKVIIDFKNSRKPKTPGKVKDAHYYEQMCAYAKMWEACTGETIEYGIVLVVSWDDKVRPFKVKLAEYESSLWDWIIKYNLL